MTKHRSISERLCTAKSLSTRREIAHEWSTLWQNHHENTIAQLERALGSGRIAESGRLLGELKSESAKRFMAFPRVIEALTDEDIA